MTTVVKFEDVSSTVALDGEWPFVVSSQRGRATWKSPQHMATFKQVEMKSCARDSVQYYSIAIGTPRLDTSVSSRFGAPKNIDNGRAVHIWFTRRATH